MARRIETVMKGNPHPGHTLEWGGVVLKDYEQICELWGTEKKATV